MVGTGPILRFRFFIPVLIWIKGTFKFFAFITQLHYYCLSISLFNLNNPNEGYTALLQKSKQAQ